MNDHRTRCDALVLIPHKQNGGEVSVVNIPLDDLTSGVTERLLKDLKGLLSSAGVRTRELRQSTRVYLNEKKKKVFKDILRELWQKVARPVLEGLAYQKEKIGELPRIWWCATGSLSFLPIHAAGLYDAEESDDNLSNYFVSSYTQTLTAILDQFQRSTAGKFQILTVAQPATPYAKPLPMTAEEIKLIKQCANGLHVVDLSSEQATVEGVLQKMQESNWIHLACHGEQNIADPMRSGFLLHDQTLELSRIVQTSLPNADFAFLSACQTAVGDEKVADESVHLAAGMLLAGCRGVIATMWSIGDEDAPIVAESVYSRILKDGVPDRKAAAHALQEGVKRLRESGADFLSWVPYIHIGR